MDAGTMIAAATQWSVVSGQWSVGDAGFVAAGMVAGGIYFALLRWNTVLYTRPGRMWTAALLQVVRLGGLAGLLAIAARHGALPLLLSALGVLIARPFVVRWMAPAP
jgi:hypothetical protein